LIRSELGFGELIINDRLKFLRDNNINALAKVTLNVLSVFPIQVSYWVIKYLRHHELVEQNAVFVTRILKEAISFLQPKMYFCKLNLG
jgi:hypothetical protein